MTDISELRDALAKKRLLAMKAVEHYEAVSKQVGAKVTMQHISNMKAAHEVVDQAIGELCAVRSETKRLMIECEYALADKVSLGGWGRL